MVINKKPESSLPWPTLSVTNRLSDWISVLSSYIKLANSAFGYLAFINKLFVNIKFLILFNYTNAPCP